MKSLTHGSASSIALIVALLVSSVASRATDAATLLVPGDFPTIQSALNAATDSDEIVVAPGGYNEAIDLLGKAVHLRSAEGADVTIIDGTGLNASVVTIASGEGPDTILEGFTIAHGDVGDGKGGGMRIDSSDPIIINCIIAENTAKFGGGVHNRNGSPTFAACVFDSNDALFFVLKDYYSFYAGEGGGLHNTGLMANPTLHDCIFRNNNTAFKGGGLMNDDGDPVLVNCTFEGNTAGAVVEIDNIGDGGGMWNGSGSPTLENCSFVNNNAYCDGGGLYNSSGDPMVNGCAFVENTSTNGNNPSGGGIHHRNGHLSLTRSVISNNDIHGTTENGGGVAVQFGTVTVLECDFIENSLGALYFGSNGATISQVAQSTFQNNTGGGLRIAINVDPVQVWDSEFIGNTPDHIIGPWEDLGGNVFDKIPPPPPPPPDTDLNNNGVTDNVDLAILLGAWGGDGAKTGADINDDGVVNGADLAILLANWSG